MVEFQQIPLKPLVGRDKIDTNRHPVIFSDNDWGVQSPSQHSIVVPLPFSAGDLIPRNI